MNYKQTLSFLFNSLPVYQRVGKAAYKADLNNTIAFDKYFGHPHKCFDSIHIAGTNGKGSVSHMIASILATAGLKTGLYTSPHLSDFRERIKINGMMISEDEVVRFVALNRKIIEAISPSFFEMTVAMAFDYFARMKVDIAVIETGMGGRLDSTNIITPLLSVITNIGHDHMEFLGDTMAAIAAEKAGIIKPGIPVVVGESDSETDPVFIGAAKNINSFISFADKNYSCVLEPYIPTANMRGFTLMRLADGYEIKGQTPLPGDYQSKNIATVIQAMELVSEKYRPGNDIITKGIEATIESTGLRGRWQVTGHNPLIVCDTAHNREGLEWVMSQIKKLEFRKLHMVVGFVNDKDLSVVLPVFPTEAIYYFTRASVPRSLDTEVLVQKAAAYGLMGKAFSDVRTALNTAIAQAEPEDMIFVGGSTFVVAEVV